MPARNRLPSNSSRATERLGPIGKVSNSRNRRGVGAVRECHQASNTPASPRLAPEDGTVAEWGDRTHAAARAAPYQPGHAQGHDPVHELKACLADGAPHQRSTRRSSDVGTALARIVAGAKRRQRTQRHAGQRDVDGKANRHGCKGVPWRGRRNDSRYWHGRE